MRVTVKYQLLPIHRQTPDEFLTELNKLGAEGNLMTGVVTFGGQFAVLAKPEDAAQPEPIGYARDAAEADYLVDPKTGAIVKDRDGKLAKLMAGPEEPKPSTPKSENNDTDHGRKPAAEHHDRKGHQKG